MPENIERIILRHSGRGMDLLSQYLPTDFCGRAVAALLKRERGNVFIVTGFYANGAGETDGPPGSYFLGMGLIQLGFHPIIVTDKYCKDYFNYHKGIETVYVPLRLDNASAFCENIVNEYHPIALISIERCGRNAVKRYCNMYGVDISEYTAPIDEFFLLNRSDLLKIAIGDGGNEIGMGLLREVIERQLMVSPCIIPADHLIISTVSNWGSFGLLAYLQMYSGFEVMPTGPMLEDYFDHILACGAVDGIRGSNSKSADGFELKIDREILSMLRKSIQSSYYRSNPELLRGIET